MGFGFFRNIITSGTGKYNIMSSSAGQLIKLLFSTLYKAITIPVFNLPEVLLAVVILGYALPLFVTKDEKMKIIEREKYMKDVLTFEKRGKYELANTYLNVPIGGNDNHYKALVKNRLSGAQANIVPGMPGDETNILMAIKAVYAFYAFLTLGLLSYILYYRWFVTSRPPRSSASLLLLRIIALAIAIYVHTSNSAKIQKYLYSSVFKAQTIRSLSAVERTKVVRMFTWEQWDKYINKNNQVELWVDLFAKGGTAGGTVLNTDYKSPGGKPVYWIAATPTDEPISFDERIHRGFEPGPTGTKGSSILPNGTPSGNELMSKKFYLAAKNYWFSLAKAASIDSTWISTIPESFFTTKFYNERVNFVKREQINPAVLKRISKAQKAVKNDVTNKVITPDSNTSFDDYVRLKVRESDAASLTVNAEGKSLSGRFNALIDIFSGVTTVSVEASPGVSNNFYTNPLTSGLWMQVFDGTSVPPTDTGARANITVDSGTIKTIQIVKPETTSGLDNKTISLSNATSTNIDDWYVQPGVLASEYFNQTFDVIITPDANFLRTDPPGGTSFLDSVNSASSLTDTLDGDSWPTVGNAAPNGTQFVWAYYNDSRALLYNAIYSSQVGTPATITATASTTLSAKHFGTNTYDVIQFPEKSLGAKEIKVSLSDDPGYDPATTPEGIGAGKTVTMTGTLLNSTDFTISNDDGTATTVLSGNNEDGSTGNWQDGNDDKFKITRVTAEPVATTLTVTSDDARYKEKKITVISGGETNIVTLFDTTGGAVGDIPTKTGDSQTVEDIAQGSSSDARTGITHHIDLEKKTKTNYAMYSQYFVDKYNSAVEVADARQAAADGQPPLQPVDVEYSDTETVKMSFRTLDGNVAGVSPIAHTYSTLNWSKPVDLLISTKEIGSTVLIVTEEITNGSLVTTKIQYVIINVGANDRLGNNPISAQVGTSPSNGFANWAEVWDAYNSDDLKSSTWCLGAGGVCSYTLWVKTGTTALTT